MSNDVVNDALGLAQFLTKHRGEEAVEYLLAIENLKFLEWKEAKELLPIDNKINRQTKEGHIRDIVSCFVNNDIEKRYLVANLALCPGFQLEALQLISYTAGTFYAVKKVADKIVKHSEKQRVSEVYSNKTSAPSTTIENIAVSNNSAADLSPAIKSYRDAANKPSTSTNNKLKSNKRNIWTNGRCNTGTEDQTPQLIFKCIAVKSGPDETAKSLKIEFEKIWRGFRNLRIDAYSRTDYSTMFRVQFDMPALLLDKLTDPTSWPTRISIRPWRGNPKTQLKSLAERQEQRKVYVGNLSPTITMDKIVSNMKVIYSEEMTAGSIVEITAHLNTIAWKKQNELKAENLQYVMRKSACVVIKSKPGNLLPNLNLKFNHNAQVVMRPWNGPLPPPAEDSMTKASSLNLTWS